MRAFRGNASISNNLIDQGSLTQSDSFNLSQSHSGSRNRKSYANDNGSRNRVPISSPHVNMNSMTADNFNRTNNNAQRAQQIEHLHYQFKEIKKKIKQVQSKNEKIIQKIHKEYDFKKKNMPPQTFDLSVDNAGQPIVYYQKPDRPLSYYAFHVSGVSGGMGGICSSSVDQNDSSNKSDQSQYQYRHKKNPRLVPSSVPGNQSQLKKVGNIDNPNRSSINNPNSNNSYIQSSAGSHLPKKKNPKNTIKNAKQDMFSQSMEYQRNLQPQPPLPQNQRLALKKKYSQTSKAEGNVFDEGDGHYYPSHNQQHQQQGSYSSSCFNKPPVAKRRSSSKNNKAVANRPSTSNSKNINNSNDPHFKSTKNKNNQPQPQLQPQPQPQHNSRQTNNSNLSNNTGYDQQHQHQEIEGDQQSQYYYCQQQQHDDDQYEEEENDDQQHNNNRSSANSPQKILQLQTHQHLGNEQQSKQHQKKGMVKSNISTFNNSDNNNKKQPQQSNDVSNSDIGSQQQNSRNQSISIYKLQETLKLEKQKIVYLQEQLKKKEIQAFNFKAILNKTNSHSQYNSILIGDQLDTFMEVVIKRGMMDIEKNVKRNENKLKNLAITLKDSFQQHKSSRVIRENRLRRSNSRSKRDASPSQNISISSAITSNKVPRPVASANNLSEPVDQTSNSRQRPLSKSKIQSEARTSKDFQGIVNKYQGIISSKIDEIEKLQGVNQKLKKRNLQLEYQLQAKDKQIEQIKIKKDELERLMSETDYELPIIRRITTYDQKETPVFTSRKKTSNSNESNLLQDQCINEINHVQAQFQVKFLKAKHQLQQKTRQISELTRKLNTLEKQALNLKMKSGLPPRKDQKSSQQIKQMEKEYQQACQKLIEQAEILNKQKVASMQAELDKCTNHCENLQKTLIQRQCEIESIQKRIKKFQVSTQSQTEKILELQKLLNQSNPSSSTSAAINSKMQMLLLQNSMCDQDLINRDIESIDSEQKSSQQRKTGETSQSQNDQRRTRKLSSSVKQISRLESQLFEKSTQCLDLTKKLKAIEGMVDSIQIKIDVLESENTELSEKNDEQVKTIQQLRALYLQQLQQKEQQQQSSKNQQKDHDRQVVVQNENPATNNNEVNQSVDFDDLHSQYFSDSEIQKSEYSYSNSKQPDSKSEKKVICQSDAPAPQKQQPQSATTQQQKAKRIQTENTAFKQKNVQLSKTLGTLKLDHLQISRENINLRKQNEYLADSLGERQRKYQKLKKQFQQIKIKNVTLLDQCKQKEEQLQIQKQENHQKIKQLEKQWQQFQEQINKNNNGKSPNPLQININNNDSDLLRNSRYNVSESSILLSSTIHNKNTQYLQQKNEYLQIKLKEAQAAIEIHNRMEQKVLEEYKANVEKLRQEKRQKNKEIQQLKLQNGQTRNRNRKMQLLYQSRMRESRVSSSAAMSESNCKLGQPKNAQDKSLSTFKGYSARKKQNANDASFNETDREGTLEDDHEQLDEETENNPYVRILDLEGQLKEARDINVRLQEMDEQIFKQIRLKQQEKGELLKVIEQKSLRIQEMEDIIDLKQAANLPSSHLSVSNQRSFTNTIKGQSNGSNPNNQNQLHPSNPSQRGSMQSHSSLRYSALTNLRRTDSTILKDETNSIHPNEPLQIQLLSDNSSELLDRSSYNMTNISEIFQKDDFPYEKVQLKRKEQIKLFEKTALYIKSLKDSINEKNRQIKLFEKKIESLKHSHLPSLLGVGSVGQSKYQVFAGGNSAGHTGTEHNILGQDDGDQQTDMVFKDYESVQIQRKGINKHGKRYKSLEHEWKLAIEQNNVLSSQIQALQEELDKAEQHEKTILNIKELYKNQINNLMAQVKQYEKELSKDKKKVNESEQVHNVETMKQLFIKVIECMFALDNQRTKRKKQEKKKQMEGFFKVFASLAGIDEKSKQKLTSGIRNLNGSSRDSHSNSSKKNSGEKDQG